MAKSAKGRSRSAGAKNVPSVEKKKEKSKEPIIPQPLEGIQKANDGFSLIDDEVITPRAFDRTTRSRKKEKESEVFTFGESFGMDERGSAGTGSKLKDDTFNEIINKTPEPLHVMPLNQKASNSKSNKANTKFMNDFINNNNTNNNNKNSSRKEKEKEIADTSNNITNNNNILNNNNLNSNNLNSNNLNSNNLNSNNLNNNNLNNNNLNNNNTNEVDNNRNIKTNNVQTHAREFDFQLDETPIKSNVANTTNNETESSPKKYRTPGEIDMIEPDDSLIGNKCITINNYVSPPKFVNRVGSFSRFPLSGEADINLVDYNGFRNLFKNCACVISEQEYLESSSKESNTNPMQSLRDEETDGENEEENETGENEENRGDERRKRENRNENYDMHETPNKFTRSNTALPTGSGNRLGNSPNRNNRRRGDKPINTSKLLDALNIEHDKKDKSKSQKRSLDDDKNGSDKKKNKKSNENDDKYIDFELKPVFKKDMEGKSKENAQILLMEELVKKKKNIIKLVLKPCSDELNVIFKKDVCVMAKLIYHAYSTLNYVISRRNMLNEPLYFKIMRGELQRLGGGSFFTEDLLRQLAWIAPSLIILNKITVRKEILERHLKVYPEQGTGKKVEDIEVRENSNERPNIYKLSTKEKLDICQKSIISWVNVKHNEFLKSLNSEFYLPQYYELKKWHSKFNFDEVTFPLVELTEDKVAARLSFTPHESNTDDFIVENDSPLKTVTINFETHQNFMDDMEQNRTRTPLGRNKRKSNFGSPFASPFNYASPKKETKNMKIIREDANKKKIINMIKTDLEAEEEKLLSEKKYWENAKWIGEIIHDAFVVEGTHTVIELLTFSKKIAEKYKSVQTFNMDEKKIAQIIEVLAEYIPDITIKPALSDKTKISLSVKSKKNLHFFLEPVAKKAEAIAKRYNDVKANKEDRLRELWNKHEVPFQLTENIKKHLLNPGSVPIADL